MNRSCVVSNQDTYINAVGLEDKGRKEGAGTQQQLDGEKTKGEGMGAATTWWYEEPIEELHKHVLFAAHEKNRRKIANKRYRENSKLKQEETIALRRKRLVTEKAGLQSELSVAILDQVAEAIHMIIKLCINERISESSENFR